MLRTVFFLLVFSASLTFAQNCTTYLVVATFDTKTTKGIDNLQAQNFVAHSGRLALPVISARQDFNNRVLVLVETSTKADKPELQTIARRIGDLVRDAPATRPLAFGVFAEKAVLTSGFFTEPSKRATAIDDVLAQAAQIPGRSPALFDSLDQALAVFGPRQPGDTILLVADGYDVKSKHSAAYLTEAFAEKGTRLLVLFQPKPSLPQEKKNVRLHYPISEELMALSSSTGGGYRFFELQHELEFAWAGYMLGIQVPAAWNKPRTWELKVRNSNGKTDDNTLIFFPWKLTPCSSLIASAQ
jgi:hypothetical protein